MDGYANGYECDTFGWGKLGAGTRVLCTSKIGGVISACCAPAPSPEARAQACNSITMRSTVNRTLGADGENWTFVATYHDRKQLPSDYSSDSVLLPFGKFQIVQLETKSST